MGRLVTRGRDYRHEWRTVAELARSMGRQGLRFKRKKPRDIHSRPVDTLICRVRYSRLGFVHGNPEHLDAP